MRRPGLFLRLFRYLFGAPAGLPAPEAPQGKRPPCGSMATHVTRCEGLADPRCKAGSCTAHCREHCRGLCLGEKTAKEPETSPRCSLRCGNSVDPRCEAKNCTRCCWLYCWGCGARGERRAVRVVTEETATLRDVVDLFGAAPVPAVASVVTCPCGQKNRIRHSDFGKGPVCGRCKRALGLPS